MPRWARWLLTAWLAMWLAAPVQAEIWAYRDQHGQTHYAKRPLHDRYELLYRDASTSGPTDWSSSGLATASAVTRMELSTRFRVVRHLIREAAKQHGLEFELLQAVIATESGFDPQAVSPKGAVGLMQLMPETAARFGVRPQGALSVSERLTDPRTNIQAGSRYLAWLIQHFKGDVRLAIAAYNAGEGAVLKAGRRIPKYPETIDYVRKVTDLKASLMPPRTVREARADTLPATELPLRAPGPG